MSSRIVTDPQTRKNWLIDALVFLGGVVSALSGIYFLFLPSGGYQGGRNPMYGVTILFSRHTWDDLHTWGGVLMIAAAVVHFAIHWRWVKMMGRRIANAMLSRATPLSRGATLNVALDVVVAASFVLTAASGLYFLFAPAGGLQGGLNPGRDAGFVFSRTTWDLIHTWAGVVFISAGVVHFWIHWRWVKNVTRKVFLSITQRREIEKAPATS